jgi:malonyl-CoA/methylmalonyl-CoA synthetase
VNSLYDALIAPHADNDTPFLIPDQGTPLTYASFVRRAAQIAHVLQDAGVTAGDRVLVQAPKTTDMVALYAATVQAAGVFLPLNSAYTQAELSYFITDADPALIVCDAKDAHLINALVADRDIPVLTLTTDGTGTLSRAADAAPDQFDTRPRRPDDLAGLLYTSGTTGRSKGAMMSHRNLLSNAQALTDLWRMTSRDHLIHALPIFHTHGLFVAMNTSLLAGATVRFMERFDVDAVLAAMPKATLMMGVPTFYTRLLASPAFTADVTRNMRLFISGSAPLLAETHTAFEDRTGHRILERYGMTETNMITSNPYDGARVAGTVGFALPGTEVRITQDGTPLPAGEIGMIEVRGDNVFQGYWKMPEKTKEELRADGFFMTGDLGTMDADGRVTIVGRQKDLVISGGYNIYPKEIEDVLNNLPEIVESAVFGIPDPDFGERVVAALVPLDAPIDETAVRAHVAKALASFKHPKRYVILDALPRNTMGKVQKNQLRAIYQDG